jgi:predicted ribonuclease YlaK
MNERVILVSKDISTRLKADALGIEVEDYESGKVNTDLLYVGYREVTVDAPIFERVSSQLIRLRDTAKTKGKKDKDKQKEESVDSPSAVVENIPHQETSEMLKSLSILVIFLLDLDHAYNVDIEANDLCCNEFIILREKQSHHSVTIRWRKMPSQPVPTEGNGEEKKQATPNLRFCHLSIKAAKAWNVESRSKEQMMALEVLQDPDIKLVTLVGQAGTGKTLLALASGLDQVFGTNRYEKILITRPIMPLGKDIGYLPGGKDDKLLPWMQPIFDNLDFLVPKKDNSNENKYALLGELDDEEDEKAEDSIPSVRRRRRRTGSQLKSKKETEDFDVVTSLTQDKAMSRIQMEAIAYIRYLFNELYYKARLYRISMSTL